MGEVDGKIKSGKGFQPTYPYECSQCRDDGTVSEAVAFCTVCTEYLCRDCLKYHKRSKALKGHFLVEGNLHLAAETPASYSTSSQDSVFCYQHRTTYVSHFCSTHEELICGLCVSVSHGKCDCKTLKEACRSYNVKDKATEMVEEYKRITDIINTVQSERAAELSQLLQQEGEIYGKIKTLRDEINCRLDQLEAEMSKQVKQKVEEEATKIQAEISSIGQAVSVLDEERDKLQQTVTSGRDLECFIALKTSSLKSMQEFHRNVSKTRFMSKVMLEIDPDVNNMKRLKQIGTIALLPNETERKQTVLKYAPLSDETERKQTVFKYARARTLSRYGVRKEDDRGTCEITGCLFLPDNRLLLCDCGNKKLKLLDDKFSLYSSLTLSSGPWDITQVSSQEVVVTLPWESKLQFVSLTPTLGLSRTVNIRPGRCRGIHFHRDRLYVSCTGPSCVLVCDSDGGVLQQFVNDEQGTRQFTCPSYLTVDTEGRILVSDYSTRTVTCLGPDGQTTHSYTDTDLKSPRCILVDDNQVALVCGYDSNNIQVISPDGRKVKQLIGPGDGLHGPLTMAYRADDDTLVVGMYNSDSIITYKLS